MNEGRKNMTELNWRDNSKEMFEKLIESLPKSFKPMMEKKQAKAGKLPKT